ncbi:MAG: RNase H superfamily protein [Bacteroidetes bacterium]|nr:RNase H superfamily protein [Bacteroidota bacterium]
MKQIRPRIYPNEYEMILKHREKTGTQQHKHLTNKRTLPQNELPKVLLIDIETSQMEVKVWQLFGNQHIGHDRITKPPFIMCFSAKWLFDDNMISHCVMPQEAIIRDDKRIMQKAWDLLDRADIIIGHNCNKFDRRKINSRFFIHKMLPPSPYKIIDTLTESRKQFGHPSQRLDYISGLISGEHKLKTDKELWDRCENGDPAALAEMSEYCDRDVDLLEDAYMEIRPWIRSHPNLALFVHTDSNEKYAPYICPVCAEEIIKEEIEWDYSHTTTISKFKAFRHSCGAYIHTRNNYKVAVIKSVP